MTFTSFFFCSCGYACTVCPYVRPISAWASIASRSTCLHIDFHLSKRRRRRRRIGHGKGQSFGKAGHYHEILYPNHAKSQNMWCLNDNIISPGFIVRAARRSRWTSSRPPPVRRRIGFRPQARQMLLKVSLCWRAYIRTMCTHMCTCSGHHMYNNIAFICTIC